MTFPTPPRTKQPASETPTNTAEPEPEPEPAPGYGDGMSKAEFTEAVREYSETVDIEVDMSEVEIDVSTSMQRAAAKVRARKDFVTDEIDLLLRIAWGGYQKWGWNDHMEGVIRHELVHIWEYQQFGDSNHGVRFKTMAGELDAPLESKQFADYKYELFCADCGEFVCGRYQRSKVVKNADEYRSKCCESPLTLETE